MMFRIRQILALFLALAIVALPLRVASATVFDTSMSPCQNSMMDGANAAVEYSGSSDCCYDDTNSSCDSSCGSCATSIGAVTPAALPIGFSLVSGSLLIVDQDSLRLRTSVPLLRPPLSFYS
jgi:hypothetical protein